MQKTELSPRLKLWFKIADAWAERHGLTREQVISIYLHDGPHSPDDPDHVMPTYRDLFFASSIDYDLLDYLNSQPREASE